MEQEGTGDTALSDAEVCEVVQCPASAPTSLITLCDTSAMKISKISISNCLRSFLQMDTEFEDTANYERIETQLL